MARYERSPHECSMHAVCKMLAVENVRSKLKACMLYHFFTWVAHKNIKYASKCTHCYFLFISANVCTNTTTMAPYPQSSQYGGMRIVGMMPEDDCKGENDDSYCSFCNELFKF